MNKIPFEIQKEIIGYCDLASVVSLHDTCVSWRQVCSEDVLAAKVKSRVPWMIPGEQNTGLETWALCARVILARRKACDSGQLAKLELLDRVHLEHAKKQEDLVPQQVTTLPPGYEATTDVFYFRSLEKEGQGLITVRLQLCGSSLYVDGEYVVDLHTLEIKRNREGVQHDNTVLYFSLTDIPNVYAGAECTIELPDTAIPYKLEFGEKHAVVYYSIEVEGVQREDPESKQVFVMNKKPQMSYKDGLVFDYNPAFMKFMITREAVFMVEVKDPHFLTYWLDLDTGNRVLVVKSEFEQPYDPWTLWYEHVITYNGLLFHSYDAYYVPLVVDLDHLDRTSYKKDHIMSWDVIEDTVQGKTGCESFFGGSYLETADMATYTTYGVKGEPDNEEVIFPGTVDGRFGYWKWSKDFVDRIIDRALFGPAAIVFG